MSSSSSNIISVFGFGCDIRNETQIKSMFYASDTHKTINAHISHQILSHWNYLCLVCLVFSQHMDDN